MKNKKRIDILLVERKLADSRSKAQRMVMAGQVRVDGQMVFKSSSTYGEEVEIKVDSGQKYVSRGGEKLEAALNSFAITVIGRICADVGASTGGFTDCLLQHGAHKVYAIDVGKGILDWKLRQNQQVIVMEGVNARYIEMLPEVIDLITIDASFISSKVLLPVVQEWFHESSGYVILLIKPQFEAGKSEVSRGKGVIRDPEIHKRVLYDVLDFAQKSQYEVLGLIRSPLIGPKGNTEFLACLRWPGQSKAVVTDLIARLFSNQQSNDFQRAS
jgi:23S rRNA (cytidine1920-2'-O)/16S rRNA (cytidine1409-2'-O)-methyltransferase